MVELQPEATIYQNDVKQGLEQPCFFIIPLSSDVSKLPMNRMKFTFPIQLTFIAPDNSNKAYLLDVAEDILINLDVLTLKDGFMVRTLDKSFEIVDGVLQISIKYSYFSTSINSEDNKFETLKTGVY